MSVSDTLKAFVNAGKLISLSKNDTTINLDKLQEYLDLNNEAHRNITAIIMSIPVKDRVAWVKDKLVTQLREDLDGPISAYKEYVSGLKGKAATSEAREPFSSLIYANNEYSSIVRQISDLLSEEYPTGTKEIKVSELRVSSLVIFGLLGMSDALIRFSCTLITAMIQETVATKDPDAFERPKYRTVYLKKHSTTIAELVNNTYSHGSGQLSELIKNIRAKGGDLLVSNIAEVGSVGTAIIDLIGSWISIGVQFIKPIFALMTSGSFSLWAGNAAYERYERNKEVLEWMQRHVAMLRMELQGTSSDDPRYEQLVKIINAYDARITDYDRRLQEYENSVN